MAVKPIQVLIELLTKDRASKDIDAVSATVNKLDGSTAEVGIEADADDAKSDIKRAGDDLRKLDGDTAKVGVEADADDAKSDIDRVTDELRKLDGDTAKVNIDTSGVDDMVDKLGGLPGPLGALTSTLGAGGTVAAGVGGIGAGLLAAGNYAADLAIEAATTAQLTGDTVEGASALQSVWRTSGADVNDLNDVVLQMNGVLSTTPEYAKQLGINLNDGKTIGQRFIEVVDKIGASNLNAADKAKLMSAVFGEEGVRQVAKLTTVIDGPLADAVDGIADSRLVHDEDVEAAQEMKAQVAELQAGFSAAAQELGRNVLPLMTKAAEAATKITEGLPGGTHNTLLNPISSKDFNEMMDQIEGWKSSYNQAASETLAAYNAQLKLFDGVTSAAGAMDTASSASDQLWGAVGRVTDEFGRLAPNADRVKESMARTGELAETLADQQLARLSEETSDLSGITAGLANELDGVFGSALDMQGAADQLVANFDDLSASVKENGTSLDNNTEKGRANREQVRQSVAGIQEYIGKLIESGASNQQAGAEYATLRGQLVQQVRQFGLTEGAANDYINQLGLTPDSVNTAVNLNNVNLARDLIRQHISQIGAIPASKLTTIETAANTGDLDRVKRELASLERNVIVRVQTIATGGAYSPPGVNRAVAGGGTIQALATGGESRTPTLLVGENGPEIVRLPVGSHVYKNNETRQILDGAKGSSGDTFNIYGKSDADIIAQIQASQWRKRAVPVAGARR